MKTVENSRRATAGNNRIFPLLVVLSFTVVILCMATAYFRFSPMGIISIIFASAFTSAICLIFPKFYTALILGAFSLILNLLAFRNIEAAVFALSVYPAGYIFYLLFKKKTTRTQSILCLSLYFGAFFLFFSMFEYLYGASSPSFFSFLRDAKEKIYTLVDLIRSIIVESYSILYYEAMETMPPEQKANMLKNMQLILQLYLPGVFILSLNFISYMVTAAAGFFFKIFYSITSAKRFHIEKNNRRISLSFVSAIILPLAILFSMFFDENTDILYLFIIYNLIVILSPPFFIMGLYHSFDYLKENFDSSRSKCITLIVVAVLALFIMPSLLIYYQIFAGLFSVAKKTLKDFTEKIRKEAEKSEDDDDDDYF